MSAPTARLADAAAGDAPRTLAQKLIARASGSARVEPGEIVTCRVDLAMFHDSSGPRRLKPMLERLQARVWDPQRIVLVTDHYYPEHDEESRQIVKLTRDWAREQQVGAFYEGEGICHVLLAQKGHLRPGMFAVGGDSHSCTGGALGAYIFGVGATEMLSVVVTGELWLRVPQTILIDWRGRFADGVMAKDVMLFLCGRFGMNGGRYEAVEYAGEAVRALPMQERMTLANLTAEFGGQVGLVGCDEITIAHLNDAGVRDSIPGDWRSDPGAQYLERHSFDACALAPQVSAPSSPANAADAADYDQRIDIAYVGACTGAKLIDLRAAARVLKGRRVAPGVELLVAPASRQDQLQAAQEGVMQSLEQSGARILPNACGACAGYGMHRFGENTRVISSTARNFKGRMGADSSQVFLASPYTVAASALTGRITDPRGMLA